MLQDVRGQDTANASPTLSTLLMPLRLTMPNTAYSTSTDSNFPCSTSYLEHGAGLGKRCSQTRIASI